MNSLGGHLYDVNQNQKSENLGKRTDSLHSYIPPFNSIKEMLDNMFLLNLFYSHPEYFPSGMPCKEDINSIIDKANSLHQGTFALPDLKLKFLIYALNDWEYLSSHIDTTYFSKTQKEELLEKVVGWSYNCSTSKDYDVVNGFKEHVNELNDYFKNQGLDFELSYEEAFGNSLLLLQKSFKEENGGYKKDVLGSYTNYKKLVNKTLSDENIKDPNFYNCSVINLILNLNSSIITDENINHTIVKGIAKNILMNFSDYNDEFIKFYESLNDHPQKYPSFWRPKTNTKVTLLYELFKISRVSKEEIQSFSFSNNQKEDKKLKEYLYNILSGNAKVDMDFAEGKTNDLTTDIGHAFIHFYTYNNPEKTDSLRSKIVNNLLNEYVNDTKNSIIKWVGETFSYIEFSGGIKLKFAEELLSKPQAFAYLYSLYLENRDLYSPGFTVGLQTRLNRSAKIYSEFNDENIEISRKKVLQFYLLSQFLSMQKDIKCYDELNAQLKEKFNDLFLSPVLYKIMTDKFSVVPTSSNKNDIINYLKSKDYNGLVRFLESNNLINYEKKNEIKSFFERLSSAKLNVPHENISFYSTPMDSVFAQSLKNEISTKEEWIDYLRNSFDYSVELMQIGMLQKITTTADADRLVNLIFAYLDISNVGEYIKYNKLKDIEKLQPEGQITSIIESKRAFLSSAAYYLNQNNLFYPGAYRKNKKHDCYDFASAITAMSDLGIVFETPEEFQVMYVFLSTQGFNKNKLGYFFPNIVNTKDFNYSKYIDKNTEVVKTVLKNSIRLMSWDDPHKKVLIYMYAYAFGVKSKNDFNLFNPNLNTVFEDLEMTESEQNIMFSDAPLFLPLVRQIINSESGNHLVVKWLNHNEVPEVLDDFKLSKYFDGSNTPEIIGKWMYFNRCSPNKPGSDHQAIFTYNTDGEIMLVEFRSNGKVNSITVTPSPSRKLTRYGKKWYTLWKPGRKMSVRLTRLRVNKGSINLSLHIPDKLESEFVLQ
ncbi:hypothetical protein J7J90_04665 [Candidatus Micrarchaeota archaeon]|nr:hypothetical protein [Candidatus Micrarchaeota archaeon]